MVSMPQDGGGVHASAADDKGPPQLDLLAGRHGPEGVLGGRPYSVAVGSIRLP